MQGAGFQQRLSTRRAISHPTDRALPTVTQRYAISAISAPPYTKSGSPWFKPKWDHSLKIKHLHSVVGAFLFAVRNLFGTLIFDSCFPHLLGNFNERNIALVENPAYESTLGLVEVLRHNPHNSKSSLGLSFTINDKRAIATTGNGSY